MKSIKIFLAVMLCLVGLSMTSCKGSKQEAAQQSIAEMVSNLSLPQQINSNTTMVECSYADNILSLKYQIESSKPIALKSDRLEDQIITKLRGGMISRKMVNKLVEADAQINFVYFYNSGDSIQFEFPASRLH